MQLPLKHKTLNNLTDKKHIFLNKIVLMIIIQILLNRLHNQKFTFKTYDNNVDVGIKRYNV